MIELLIVVAIIGILAIVVLLTLNPVDVIKQSRDGRRVADMKSLTGAVDFFRGNNGGSTGNVGMVYVSLPDPSATSTAGDQCQGLALPTLTPGYTYHCSSASNYENTDGTGWVPVNFKSLPSGDVFNGKLPIDPINTSSSRDYYTYTARSGQWEFTTPMESAKFGLGGSNDKVSTDGGGLATLYQVGTNLLLEPLDYGDPTLAGYWSFNEGAGSTIYDYSGENTTGVVEAGATWTTGKNGNAVALDGSAGYVRLSDDLSNTITGSSGLTICAWVSVSPKNPGVQEFPFIFGDYSFEVTLYSYAAQTNFGFSLVANGRSADSPTEVIPANNTWHYLCGVQAGTGRTTLYLDGVQSGSANQNAGTPIAPSYLNANIGAENESSPSNFFKGALDDMRIYDRTLSAQEINALYLDR